MQYGTYLCYLYIFIYLFFLFPSSLAEQSKPTKTSYQTLHGRTSCTMTSGALFSPTAAATSLSAPSALSLSASTMPWAAWTPRATTWSTWACTAASLRSSLHSVGPLLGGGPWSLLAGLLFASHPIHTEAVAGVVGRADVGAAFASCCP